MTEADVVHIHPPKVEHFNLAELTNTDPKGNLRQVEEYDVRPWGLYMARPAPDHPTFHFLESWFLPELGLRATIFHFHPGREHDQDYYLDIGEFGEVGPKLWRSVDHYLDILVRTGRETELLDVDELLQAHAAGLIGPDDARLAVERATATIDGIAAHGRSLENWLATFGITLTWRG
jgi:predicted RNA-binding protein associated with RNAse of E/G family